MTEHRTKLPVPAAWQPAVEAAREHLAARLGVPLEAVAPTRVADGTEIDPSATPGGTPALAVWLLAEARSYRYLVALETTSPTPVPVDPPPRTHRLDPSTGGAPGSGSR